MGVEQGVGGRLGDGGQKGASAKNLPHTTEVPCSPLPSLERFSFGRARGGPAWGAGASAAAAAKVEAPEKRKARIQSARRDAELNLERTRNRSPVLIRSNPLQCPAEPIRQDRVRFGDPEGGIVWGAGAGGDDDGQLAPERRASKYWAKQAVARVRLMHGPSTSKRVLRKRMKNAEALQILRDAAHRRRDEQGRGGNDGNVGAGGKGQAGSKA